MCVCTHHDSFGRKIRLNGPGESNGPFMTRVSYSKNKGSTETSSQSGSH